MATNTVKIEPSVLKWAVEDSQRPVADLIAKFPKLLDWLTGDACPTFKQLNDLSDALRVPFGYLFLKAPPTESVVETEFRTISNNLVGKPSKELEDTLLEVEQACLWMRDFRIFEGYDPLSYVGSLAGSDDEALANALRNTLSVAPDWSLGMRGTDSAFVFIRKAMEKLGVIVMIKGWAKTNAHRPLNIGEFRAFVLADEYAPVIFINGKDSHAGRLFSLVHEFAHLLLGGDHLENGNAKKETLCNRATIEFIAPKRAVRDQWSGLNKEPLERVAYLADKFNVSPHAMAIHALGMNLISDTVFQQVVRETELNLQRLAEAKPNDDGGGGSYYNTKTFSMTPEYVMAVASHVNRGMTKYTEAFNLLGVAKMKTYDTLVKKVYG